jgi:inorganic pyrophosphatase
MQTNTPDSFTAAANFIGQQVTVSIDRPLGSRHPNYGFAYPVNYGFVPNTLAPDGEELDAYVLGIDEAITHFTGTCIAVIHRTNDNDDKLVVVPEGVNLTDEQIRTATHFQEQYFQSHLIRHP